MYNPDKIYDLNELFNKAIQDYLGACKAGKNTISTCMVYEYKNKEIPIKIADALLCYKENIHVQINTHSLSSEEMFGLKPPFATYYSWLIFTW